MQPQRSRPARPSMIVGARYRRGGADSSRELDSFDLPRLNYYFFSRLRQVDGSQLLHVLRITAHPN